MSPGSASTELIYRCVSLLVLAIAAVWLVRALRAARRDPLGFRHPRRLATVLGTFWGLLLRILFSMPSIGASASVMSLGFLLFVPLVLGYLTIVCVPKNVPLGWIEIVFRPWLTVGCAIGIAAMLGFEGAICLIMAGPGWLALASVGGLIGAFVRNVSPQTLNAVTAVLAFSPLGIASLEGVAPGPSETQTVITEIRVNASPERVWEHIRAVAPIARDELPRSFVQLMGFPDPVEAALEGEGVGAVRRATFRGGVLFTETVSEWIPLHSLEFGIKANTEQIPRTTLDEHVTIGGPYFDVLTGRYDIIRADDRSVTLRLESRHRLSTRFNWYAGVWSRFIMSQIQSSILEVIRHRCEAVDPTQAGR